MVRFSKSRVLTGLAQLGMDKLIDPRTHSSKIIKVEQSFL